MNEQYEHRADARGRKSARAHAVRTAFITAPDRIIAAWFILGLSLAFGLVIMGDNWSSAEARTRRQAWAPAAVLLALTVVCFGANMLDGLWFAAMSSAANAVLFGAVVAWYLRDG